MLSGSIHADTLLNLAWAAICISALVWQWHRGGKQIRFTRGGMAVFLAAVALFPCISASDDLVRLREMNDYQGVGQSLRKSTADLVPLTLQLEDLEHAQAASFVTFLLILSFLLMVPREDAEYWRLASVNASSRAPPSL